jgi:Trehalose utilisation
MKRIYLLLSIVIVLNVNPAFAQQSNKVLIVQDELPAIKVLAKFLSSEGHLNINMVTQDSLPTNFSDYKAVIFYIHMKLYENAETAIIDYTKNGGKFICLHHSISSGKVNNKYYFKFLGIQLDHAELSPNPVKPGGGYGWFNDHDKGVSWSLVNLNPDNYITSHNVTWNQQVTYKSSDEPSVIETYPAITLKGTEAYMNHKFTDGREKTVLCGIKFYDIRNNELFMQDRAVWYKKYGKGIIYYFMPGHSVSDYENKNVAQMILNAINYDDK